jgi:hypothetical protein
MTERKDDKTLNRQVLFQMILLASSIIIFYFLIRLLFFYTIINIPYMFGMNTYESGTKYDFPVCIVNPIKTTSFSKSNISSFAERKNQQKRLSLRA